MGMVVFNALVKMAIVVDWKFISLSEVIAIIHMYLDYENKNGGNS